MERSDRRDAIDVARFALDAPDWVGWPGFFLAWGVPWLAGGWWRSWCQRGGGAGEWRVGLALLWWAAVLAVTAGFVAATAAVRSRLRRRPAAGGLPGVLVAALAGAAVGLEGPRSIPLALTCSVLFVCGWWLLGAAPLTRAGGRTPGSTEPPRRPGPAGRPTAR